MTEKTPIKLSEFHEWSKEQAKLVALQHSLNDNAEEQRNHPPTEAVMDSRSRDATALLDDGKVPADGPEWEQQLVKLQADGHILETAIKIHKERMGILQTRLSKQICEPLVKRHRALVADIIDAVKDLARANAVEAALRRELELDGVFYLPYLRPMSYKKVGLIEDPNSDINRYLKEAAEFGFMEPDKDAAA